MKLNSHGRHASEVHVLVFCPTKLACVRIILGPNCSFSHCMLAKTSMGLGKMQQYFNGTYPCCCTRSGQVPALLITLCHEKETTGQEALMLQQQQGADYARDYRRKSVHFSMSPSRRLLQGFTHHATLQLKGVLCQLQMWRRDSGDIIQVPESSLQ